MRQADLGLHGETLAGLSLDHRVAKLMEEARRGHGNIRLTLSRSASSCGPVNAINVNAIKRYTGMAFHQYLRNTRMREASVRLRNSQSARRVAEVLGYEDAANFTRDFTSYFGVTPGEYRRTHGDAV